MELENDDRVTEFKQLMHLDEESGEISLPELRKFLLLPFPEGHPDLRFYNWQLSLKVLPLRRELWKKTWEKRDIQYYGLVERMFRDSPDFLDYGLRSGRVMESIDVLTNIHGDVIRMPKWLRAIYQIVDNPEQNHIHLHRLERLIYVFSLVNSHCPYTQGFHELAAPLYYVSLAGTRALSMSDDRAESIAFFLLFNLIIGTNLYTVFANVEDLEKMKMRFKTIENAVKVFDAPFAQFLFEEKAIHPLLFCLSWVSMLFSQHLELLDLLHLWDHLLVFYDRVVDFVMMVAAAYILFRKKKIRQLDFDQILTELHTTPEMNIMPMLRIARNLWDQLFES
ncbi:hypothetical protein TRFO_10802 [Tritrichomonas foetus]|uniref:Rab-GAP TBC domain-containing protein n=1 Tax=Tritrichomonas foetus TaxID=1144522 RepID=A0A1J4J6L9_9EUKA|nr:hypothetical protein TRFO_10802 [Tritrichomonas foetus]|eukprot:OHS94874.1 hypothetical protein TRFO_10802 [Tritrichomonas foetus]